MRVLYYLIEFLPHPMGDTPGQLSHFTWKEQAQRGGDASKQTASKLESTPWRCDSRIPALPILVAPSSQSTGLL